MSRSPTDDDETGIFDGQRAKRSTARGMGNRAESLKEAQSRRAVELATPTEITPARDRSEPIVVISMKTPGEVQPDEPHPTPQVPRPKLRALSEVSQSQPGNLSLGRLAPPRDAKEVRGRRLRDGLIWGSLVIIVGCIVMLAVWFLARR
jgi:hypothetical protein